MGRRHAGDVDGMAPGGWDSDGGAVAAGTGDAIGCDMRGLLSDWSCATLMIGGFVGKTFTPIVVGALSHGAAGGAAPSW